MRDNKLIGDLKLTGITPMPKGVPQVCVTFDIDADGIINVSALERSSGSEKSIQVVANSGLTEQEIAQIVEDANKNREKDNIIRQRVELLTKADIMISDSENTFEKFKGVISSDESYPEVLEELKKTREMINDFKNNESDLTRDVNDVKRATDEFQKRALKLFQSSSKRQSESKK